MKVRELFVAIFFAFGIFWGFFRSKLLSEDEGPDKDESPYEDEGSRVVRCPIFCFRDFFGFFPLLPQI